MRIENSTELGTPDVNLRMPDVQERSALGSKGLMRAGWDGWIELKVQVAPKRNSTIFRCEHFTYEQRQWLVSRCRTGGNAFLLLQVEQSGKESLPGSGRYFWIRGDIAAVWVGQCTLAALLAKCDWAGGDLCSLVEYLGT